MINEIQIYPFRTVTQKISKVFDYVVIETSEKIVDKIWHQFATPHTHKPFKTRDVDYCGSGCLIGSEGMDVSFVVRKTKVKEFCKFLKDEYGIAKITKEKGV